MAVFVSCGDERSHHGPGGRREVRFFITKLKIDELFSFWRVLFWLRWFDICWIASKLFVFTNNKIKVRKIRWPMCGRRRRWTPAHLRALNRFRSPSMMATIFLQSAHRLKHYFVFQFWINLTMLSVLTSKTKLIYKLILIWIPNGM